MKKKVALYILLGIFFIGLFVLYYHYTSTFGYTSDNANAVIEDKSILAGNIFLKGWTVPIDNMLLTDAVFMIPLILLRGGIFAMKFFPTLVFFILLLLSLYTSGLYKLGKEKFLSTFLTFLAIAFPTTILFTILLNGPNHQGTMVLIFISIFASLFIAKKRNLILGLAVLFLSSLIANFSDPQYLIMGALPLIVVSLIHMYKEEMSEKKLDIYIIVSIILGVFLSTEARNIISSFGGVIFAPQQFIFTDIPGMLNNLFLMIKLVLTEFGADFTNLTLGNPDANYALIHLSFLIVILIAIIYFGKKYLKNPTKADRLDEILFFSIVLDFVAVLISKFPVDIGSIRYIFPILFFGSILAARIISKYLKDVKTIYIYLVAITIAFILNLQYTYTTSAYYASPRIGVENYLISHHLYRGYSNYWDSSITTVETNEKVHVSGVLFANGYLYPYKWSSEDKYYRGQLHFVMYSSPDLSVYSLNTFGKPDRVVKIDTYTILIWNKNISPLLKN